MLLSQIAVTAKVIHHLETQGKYLEEISISRRKYLEP